MASNHHITRRNNPKSHDFHLQHRETSDLAKFEGAEANILTQKSEEVAGDWRKLHNEELHNLYTPPNVKMIKSKRIIYESWGIMVGGCGLDVIDSG
jgi:hypothetical protein